MTQSTTQNPAANVQDRINYADMNRSTFEGRVLHAEEFQYKGNAFVRVNVVSTLRDGTEGAKLTFTDGQGLLSLFRKGYLMAGRRVFVHGHIANIASAYEKDGQLVALKRPEITLWNCQVDLGAIPKSANVKK